MAYQDRFYTVGAVSVQNGSAVATGTGTGWETALIDGGVIFVGGGSYPIYSVESETSLTLAYPYSDTSGADLPYAIDRQRAAATSNIQMNDRLAQIIREISVGNIEEFNALTLQPDKSLYTDSQGKLQLINFGTLGKTLISKDAGNALHYVRGDGSISVGTGVELIASDVSETAVNAWVKTGLSAYRLIYLSIDAAPTTTGDSFSVQVSSDNGSSWISTVGNYTEQAFVASGANTVVVQAIPDRISSGALSSSAEQGGIFAEIEISEFNQARRSMYSMSGSRKAPTTFAQELLMRKGIINVLQSFNAIRVLAGTGTMARFSINLWGVR